MASRSSATWSSSAVNADLADGGGVVCSSAQALAPLLAPTVCTAATKKARNC